MVIAMHDPWVDSALHAGGQLSRLRHVGPIAPVIEKWGCDHGRWESCALTSDAWRDTVFVTGVRGDAQMCFFDSFEDGPLETAEFDENCSLLQVYSDAGGSGDPRDGQWQLMSHLGLPRTRDRPRDRPGCTELEGSWLSEEVALSTFGPGTAWDVSELFLVQGNSHEGTVAVQRERRLLPRILRDNIQSIERGQLNVLAARAGICVMSDTIYEELRGAAKVFLEDIIRGGVAVMQHRGGAALTSADIETAVPLVETGCPQFSPGDPKAFQARRAAPSPAMLWCLLRRLGQYEPGLVRLIRERVLDRPARWTLRMYQFEPFGCGGSNDEAEFFATDVGYADEGEPPVPLDQDVDQDADQDAEMEMANKAAFAFARTFAHSQQGETAPVFFFDDFAKLVTESTQYFTTNCWLDWAGVVLLDRMLEAHLVRLLRRACIAAAHAGRVKVGAMDLQLARRLLGSHG